MSTLAEELNTFLRLKLGDDVSLTGEITPLQGGFDTDTFAFDITNAPESVPQELVLRLFRHAGESTRVVYESTIQNAAHAAGHPVPHVPIDSTGHSLLERPFFVMERLQGPVLGAYLDDQAVLVKIPRLMAELQVGLHQIDSTGLRSQLTGAGVDLGRLMPISLLNRISAMAEKSGDADLAAINSWLVDHWPEQPANPAICHGDFHPNNILFADGEVTGLIDWGNVMFTHPEFDVGVTHMILSIGSIDEVSGLSEEMQQFIERAAIEYLAAYRSHAPLDDALLSYYRALRAEHAYAKIVASRQGADLPYLAHDGYAWAHPALFAAIRKILENTTGVMLDPA
jgi:aminoglycoside phosphotransferase (APT) family kinase protein